jgi:hypothetical protein
MPVSLLLPLADLISLLLNLLLFFALMKPRLLLLSFIFDILESNLKASQIWDAFFVFV